MTRLMRTPLIRGGLASLVLAASIVLGAAAADKPATANPIGPDKVVYHLSAVLEQASDGLRNIRNHLEVNPKAQIVVVAHAAGVDYLMKGKKDKNGNPYESAVEQLDLEGV